MGFRVKCFWVDEWISYGDPFEYEMIHFWSDFMEGLDSDDQIQIVGISAEALDFKDNVTARGVSGIGIYANEALEAVYTGGNLSLSQIIEMTSAEEDVMWSYWSDSTPPELLA